MNVENRHISEIDSLTLLRDALLPNLLKEDEEDILYWAGKELARSYRFDSLKDLMQQTETFFAGELIQTKSAKKTLHFDWTGPLITHRLTEQAAPTFSLEAGFLAEGLQQLSGNYTEATYSIYQKKHLVTFLLQSDAHVFLDD
ncbi:DUF2507 domain-containing protein [Alkalibacterium putridalgicola]|uniref:DUF2507 domain-containing protein n=1 Tax=Alkalibacterium putridalgicola TaxID=426703 RepID=UPI0034CEAB68